MAQTVVGLFNKPSEAQEAVQHLYSNGFSNNDVDLSVGNNTADMHTDNTDFNLDKKDEHESGVTRFFKNLFSDDDKDASKYSTVAERGRSVVTVHAQSAEEAEKAADILDKYGAIDVNENDDAYDDTNTGVAPVGMFNETTGTSMNSAADTNATGMHNDNSNTMRSAKDDANSDNRSIPVIEEELQVGKRTVETGGMRLRSRIIERPVEEELRLREERVYVNRNPVNRAATDADFTSFKEGEIEMTERAEVPVVSKEARIVEEVSLGKEVNERNETVRDTVRKTEVDVENMKDKSTSEKGASWTKGDN